MSLLYTIAIQETYCEKLKSQIEKGKMSLFFINQATYLEDSRPFVPLSDVEFGTFPACQETKAVTNSELDAE